MRSQAGALAHGKSEETPVGRSERVRGPDLKEGLAGALTIEGAEKIVLGAGPGIDLDCLLTAMKKLNPAEIGAWKERRSSSTKQDP